MWRAHSYPPNWKQLSRDCKEQAGWRCQSCHIRHGAKRKSKRTGKKYPVWLHAAHVRLNDTHNPHPLLWALCPRCHGRYDYWLRLREGVITLEQLKHRILLHRKRMAGSLLSLFVPERRRLL